MERKPLIEITDLVKKFGSFTALNGVSCLYCLLLGDVNQLM